MTAAEKNPLSAAQQGNRRQSAADPLEKALRRIRRTREFPTISKHVLEINQKLQDNSVHASASELANIILKDYALTNKLLKLVNSAFYGLVAGKVTTVTRAVVLLGEDNVRLAVLSLVLFEHFKRKTEATDLKDATIQSFWCGLVAKEIANLLTGIDTEEAFICGLLHHLGKLLVIYHMPHDYREIKYHVIQKGEPETKAVKRILGISYRTLGVAVAKQWNFPKCIYKTMAVLSNEELQKKDARIDPLWAVSGFTCALATMVGEVRPSRRKAAIEGLLKRYQALIPLSVKQIGEVMTRCLDKLYSHADALQLDIDESAFLSLLCGRSDGQSTGCDHNPAHAAAEGAATHYQLTGGEELKAGAVDPAADDAVGIIIGGIQEVSNSMLGQFDPNDVALMSLEVIYRALQCQRAILFINEGRKRIMEARFGYGADIEEMVGSIKFEAGATADLFGQAIGSAKDLVVEDAHAPELFAMIPEWYRTGIDARAFIFLPVVHKQVCIGAYYADMESAGAPINSLEHKYLATLRNQLIIAIRMGS